MENPHNHEKKINIKILPLGIGGIVLFAGALVTTTIVSALAFKKKSQRRSSSENMNPSSDEVTSMKEIQTKNITSLTSDEKHNEEIISFPVVSEDQENTLIHVDSAFQREEYDNKEDSCLCRDDGNEKQNRLMRIDNENDEHVDANSSVFEEGVTLVQEHEATEVPLKDIVLEASEDEDHQERVLTVDRVKAEDNLQVQFLEEMVDHEVELDAEQMQVNHACETVVDDQSTAKEDYPTNRLINKEEKDEERVIIQDELFNEDEKDQSTEARIVDDETHNQPRKLINKEEKEDETGVQVEIEMLKECEIIKKDEIPHVQSFKEDEESEDHEEKVFIDGGVQFLEEMVDHEVALDAQQMQVTQVCETLVNGQLTAKEDSLPSELMIKQEKGEEIAQKLEEQVTIQDVSFNEDEKDQLTLAAKVNQTHNLHKKLTNKEEKEEETDVPVKIETLKEHEMVKTDEIPHVQSFKEDEIPRDQPIKEHEMVKKDEILHVQSVKEDEIPRDQSIEEHEMVKKDEIPHVQSFKQDEDNEEDVAVRAELSSDELEDSFMKEKQAFASEAWNLKLTISSVLITVWCLSHWYSKLPFVEVSLIGSLLFILILLRYRNRVAYYVKI